MSWTKPSNPNAAALLYDGGDAAYLTRVTGSTCTVNRSDDSLVAGAQPDDQGDTGPSINRLRMFGPTQYDVDETIMTSSADWVNAQEPNPGAVLPCGSTNNNELNIGFINGHSGGSVVAPVIPAIPSFPLPVISASSVGTPFTLRSPSSTGRYPVKTTALPHYKWSQLWYEQQLWYYRTAGGSAAISATASKAGAHVDSEQATVDFDVAYKDPCVVRLPEGNGWIMFLARYRAYGDIGSPGPNNSFGDIVAYWSPDDVPGFDDDSRVRGPFFFVPSFLAPYGDVQYLRVWLGVPGAVIVDDTLFLYFVAEKQVYGLTNADGTATADGALAMEVEAEIAFKAGTFVWRYSWRSLVSWISSADPATMCCEKNWEKAAGWSAYIAPLSLGGDTLGPVRVWMPSAAGSLEVFSAPYRAGTEVFDSTRIVDPAPARVADTDTSLEFVLTFAVISGVNEDGGGQPWSTRHSAYGVWRGAALPTDASQGWVHGVDFVVAGAFSVDGGGNTRFVDTDQVVASVIFDPDPTASGNEVYTDPDPVRLVDGSWLVFVGQGPPAPILQFTAEQALVERGWLDTSTV